MALFFLNSFFIHFLFIRFFPYFKLIYYSKIFPNASKSTWCAVDEELEKVIITTETDIGDNESGYEFSSGETTETASETEACTAWLR